MAAVRITAKTLAAQSGAFVLWDVEVKGLYARRQTAKGRVTYGFRYTTSDSKKREVKLGDGSHLTPDQARDLAKIEAGKVAQKTDPAAERDRERSAKTLAEVWADYDAAIVSKMRGGTPDAYRALWKKHLEPNLGHLRINKLSIDDVERMHAAITKLGGVRNARGHRQGGPVTANRALSLLSGICKRAITKGWISANPVRGVAENPETPKDVRYSDEELSLILRALEEEGDAEQIAFGLFLECAVRHANVSSAEWAEFADLDGQSPLWRIPGDKLKGGEPFEAHLSCELATKIAQYRAANVSRSPRYLFPREESRLSGKAVARKIDVTKPRLSFQSAWARISTRALSHAGEKGASLRGLKEGTVHTFKHTYLTRIANLGASASELQAMGDHADIRTSMGYVHGARSRIRDLANQAKASLPKAAR